VTVVAAPPRAFSVPIGGRILEGGTPLPAGKLGAWIWSSEEDVAELDASCTLSAPATTVVFVPPLTGTADASRYWTLLLGSGRLFRPWAQRLLGFDLLGSVHHAPCAAGHVVLWPSAVGDEAAAFAPLRRGQLLRERERLPATVTPWDQARAIRDALDSLQIASIALVTGGSLGGMVAQCLAALLGDRLAAVAPIAAPLHGTAWILGWNHLAREAILGDPSYPAAGPGLSLARQIARLSYRSEVGLAERHGRERAVPRHQRAASEFAGSGVARDRLDPHVPYRVESYFAHAGESFLETWSGVDAAARYLALLRSMDHHDLERIPTDAAPVHTWAHAFPIGIESDRLVPATDVLALHAWMQDAGIPSKVTLLPSPHGHDGFLLEGAALAPALGEALRHGRKP
jgi:homoserine O-acetyltransferase